MLVELTVKNYRSFKNEQTLSLFSKRYPKVVAKEPSSQELPDNLVYLPAEEAGAFGILKMAAIYGANASGKSNLLKSFEALKSIVIESGHLKEGEGIRFYEPYRLCPVAKKSPTFFRVEFFCPVEFEPSERKRPIRFIYEIELNHKKVLSERLDFFPGRVKANLFERGAKDTWETIKFGNHYRGGKKRISFFENNSYLSKAGSDAAASPLIRAVYHYFKRIFYYPDQLEMASGVFKDALFAQPTLRHGVAQVLSLIDTGVRNIEVKRKDISELAQPMINALSEEIRAAAIASIKNEVLFAHQRDDGKMEFFKEGDLSDGTKKLFYFLLLMLATFVEGGVLLVDELEVKLHPHIANLILRLFNDPQINRNNAQLVFTTHSIELMNSQQLRHDQIWLAEKENGETILFSLRDFDENMLKAGSPFSQWYRDGRFGGIPLFNYVDIADLFVSTIDSSKEEG